MGFLDKKERILDVVLTDKGREQLSKNQLNFTYYAFSDEGIDYSGSFSDTSGSSVSIDDYMFRNLAPEVYLKKDDELDSFLYTVPSRSKVLPEFVVDLGVAESSTISLTRSFVMEQLFEYANRKVNKVKRPLGLMMRLAIEKETIQSRLEGYVNEQVFSQTKERFENGKNIVGLMVRRDMVALDRSKILNTSTGAVVPSNFVAPKDELEAVSTRREVEVIVGIDNTDVKFKLKTSDGEVPSRAGFLVQIYESGSDGKITKVIQESVENPLSDDVVEEGFSSFLNLKVDEE